MYMTSQALNRKVFDRKRQQSIPALWYCHWTAVTNLKP